MNLHRSGRKSDWLRRPRGRWNEWQKVAAYTGGTITIGNAFTALGLVGVIAGLYLIVQEDYTMGLVFLAAGRFCDLLDGWLADKTGTKSPLGEQLDAGFDKLETVLTIATLLAVGIVPIWASVILALPQIAIAVVAYIAIRKGKQFHPSGVGKLSMALIWVAFIGFVGLRLDGWDSAAGVTWLAGLVYISVGAATLTGWAAFLGYARGGGTSISDPR